ncbi:Protein of uncharacterised function (DUF3558) [Mycobacteroides abscessus subsp. abscessus]|uniref:DUF3558 domain-containing protein n=1 Tax=Mycobacteroides abscessus TaxID=36809 RepID=A0AB33T6E2_9MYCO|nr:DUF3558 domain-containing protein [Mycobacteroides abscessus]MBE5494445.1 hypothetical protein [Mycobacteroides abscessus]MDM2419486.1 DUF3558 domain-containing protein [Mycobacteroides abscessus]MDM2426388.1 DUF3558 domain-containing protein [Mycobacteroides abscessus]MDM2429193.1 DUF3558 domain-containing protein [Mycobacteroides abscessus]MDM2433940.1 DUF3558 domain-containing protein [Mycobacteroides abscessus]
MIRPVFAICATVLVATACSTTVTSGDPTTESSATGRASAASTATNTLPGPHPPPTDSNDGTSFDPCLAYTADDLRSWGVSPGSVKDEGVGESTQRGCSWDGPGWKLQQLVVNRPVDEYLNQDNYPGAEAISIGDLRAVRWRDNVDPQRVCFIELPSQRASVGTIVGVNSPQAQRAIPDACAKAVDIATGTAKKLPK